MVSQDRISRLAQQIGREDAGQQGGLAAAFNGNPAVYTPGAQHHRHCILAGAGFAAESRTFTAESAVAFLVRDGATAAVLAATDSRDAAGVLAFPCLGMSYPGGGPAA